MQEKLRRLALVHHHRAIELDPGFCDGLPGNRQRLLRPDRAGPGPSSITSGHSSCGNHASERASALHITVFDHQSVTGDLEKVVQTYQEWIANHPPDYRAHLDLGSVYSEQGQHEKVVVENGEGLHLEPGSGITYSNLVNSLLALHRFDEVLADRTTSAGAVNPGSSYHFESLYMLWLFCAKILQGWWEYSSGLLANRKNTSGFHSPPTLKCHQGPTPGKGARADKEIRRFRDSRRQQRKSQRRRRTVLREAAIGNPAKATQAAAEGFEAGANKSGC